MNQVKSDDRWAIPNKAKSNKTSKNKFKIIYIVCVVVAVTCIILLSAFLIYYMATLGKVTEGGFCMGDESCMPGNLTCQLTICKCPESYVWDNASSNCALNSSNSAQTTTLLSNLNAIQKAVKIMYTLKNSSISATSYSGNNYSSPFGIKSVNTNGSTYFYVVDNATNVLVLLDGSFAYIKHITISKALYVEVVPYGNVYVSRYTDARVDIYDQSLSYINSITSASITNSYGIRFNPNLGYIYQTDFGTSNINAFDMSLNRIIAESYTVAQVPNAVHFHGNYSYISTTSNTIQIVSNKSVVANISNVCPSNHATDLYIDSSGYMFVACYFDYSVYLWFVNGASYVRTGQFIKFNGNPAGINVDYSGNIAVTIHNPPSIELLQLI